MTFVPSPPSSGGTLDNTREQIRHNFEYIQDTISVNHGPIKGANDGKHLYAQMPEQASAPTTAVNEGAIYCKEGTGTTTQLFFRAENNGLEFQLTGIPAAPVPAGYADNAVVTATENGGWIVLGGGLMLQYGIATSAINENKTITFPTPFTTGVFSLVASGEKNPNGITVLLRSNTLTNFLVNVSGAGTTNWMAIGI